MEAMRRGPKKRPWEVNPENVAQVRELFPKWLETRHGIVVYECPNFDSSAMGNKTFLPRMYDTVEAGMQPAPLKRSPTGNCSDEEWAQDWISAGWIHEDWFGKPTNEILDACFYYEVGRVFGPPEGATIRELRIFARENGIRIKGSTKKPILDAIDGWITGKPVARHHLMSGRLWEN
jgi:hypothetical protein